MNIIISIYLWKIFAELFRKKIINESILNGYLKEFLLFTWNYNIASQWIKHFFKKDYISSIHILTTQFENIFMNISEKLWIDIIKVWNPNKKKWENSINTWTKTLWIDKLDSNEFREIWWDDICELIKYIFFHDLWLKIRHKIAHWEIDINECNYSNNLIIVYLYILLATRIQIWKQ